MRLHASCHTFLSVMTTGAVESVFDLARRLAALQDRLAVLDRERGGVQEEIARCISELASAAVNVVSPPAPLPSASSNTFAGSVLLVLHRNPGRAFSAREIVAQLGIRDRRTRNNLRTLLSRMARDGRAVRAGYGRYTAKRT
jgi:hypothetical protein